MGMGRMNLNWGPRAVNLEWGPGGSESQLGPVDLSQKGRSLKPCKLKFSEARARSKDVFRGQGAQGAFPKRFSEARARFRGQGAHPLRD